MLTSFWLSARHAIYQVYYVVVNLAFWLYNNFKSRRSVPRPRDELLFLSATHAAAAIRAQTITSTQLVKAYIARMKEVNPIINAIADSDFESSFKKAAVVDALISKADSITLAQLADSRPLLGVPFTTKDSVSVAGRRFSIGILAKREGKAERNAEVVDRMEAAGAIFLALSTVPEMVLTIETANPIDGVTRNAYDTRRTCGGSSGGEGALLGAAASVIGIGTDVGGSIRYPAFCGGVFGFMPSPGRVPFTGIEPAAGTSDYMSLQMLRCGPLCRYAEDLPLMDRVLSGEKEVEVHDEAKRLRIFYIEDYDYPSERTSSSMKNALHRAVACLEKKHDATAVALRLPLSQFSAEMWTSSMGEGKNSVTVPSYWDAVATEKELTNSSLLRELLRAMWNGGISDTHAASTLATMWFIEGNRVDPEMLAKREELKRQIEAALGENGVLLAPTSPDVALYHNQYVFKVLSLFYTGMYNTLGYPAVQCPMGLSESGVPLGVQIVGLQGSDARLLRLAKDLEDGIGGWVPPGN